MNLEVQIRGILSEYFGGDGQRPYRFTQAARKIAALVQDIDTPPCRALGSQASTGEAMVSNLPTSCKHCGASKYERLSIVDGVCDDCEDRGPPTIPLRGQCAKCPYKLTGVMAQTGCPLCPNREAA